MATHRGAWALRAGALTAMVAGLMIVASPAQAQPKVQLESISNIELKVGGGPQSVQIRVRNRANDNDEGNIARDVKFTLTVPLGDQGVTVTSAGDGCTLGGGNTRMDCVIPELAPGQEHTIVAQLGVSPESPLQAGEDRNGVAQVTLSTSGTQTFNVRLRGPEQAPSIAQVSGTVTDERTGEPVDNAQVILLDGADREHQCGTDSQGRFNFQPSANEPITPGRIGLTARKDGWTGQTYSHPTQVGAGESVTGIRVVMTNQNVTESPTPTPEEEETSAPPVTMPPAESGGSGGGGFTTFLIIMGVLLVALGITAIVLLIIRRRREAEEDDGFDDADDPTSGPRGPGPTPGSRGVYHPTPTQVATPAPATQVLPRASGGLPAVGPDPALAETSLMRSPGAADQTAMLPRATDDAPTQLAGPSGPPVQPGPPGPRRAGPQPPTFSGAPDQPTYPGGYDQPTSYGGDDTYRYGGDGDYRSGGYDQPTGRFDRTNYGPDPYAQPPYGGEPGTRAYPNVPTSGYPSSGSGYQAPSGYGAAGYPDPTYPDAGYADPGYPEARSGYRGADPGYRDAGAEARSDPTGSYPQQSYRGSGYPPEHGSQPEYGTPTRSDYYGQYERPDRQPRSRHSAPPDDDDRRRLDWLDD